MTFKTTKTQVVEVEVKPSEVYAHTQARIFIAGLGSFWKIISFRPPNLGDHYISAPRGEAVIECTHLSKTGDPRFIVEPLKNQINEVWE